MSCINITVDMKLLWSKKSHKIAMIITATLVLVLIISYVASKPLQVINRDGICLSSDKISRFLFDQELKIPSTAGKVIDTVGVVDCTAYSDCSFVNHLFQSDFDAEESGIQLDSTGSVAVAYATFDKVFASGFCGSKAVDYQCALHASTLKATTCVAVKSIDFEATMKSFDQIYRRFLQYAYTRTSIGCGDPMNIILLVDESGAGSLKETNTADYQIQIEKYLESIWTESYGKIPFGVAVKVKVVSVKADEPHLLKQAQDSLAEVIMKDSVVRMTSADMVAEGVTDLSVSEVVQPPDGTAAEELAQVLHKAWIRLPKDPVPVLSLSERNSLFLVESAHTACMEQAETAIRQWQTRTAKGRRIVGFPLRVGQLLAAVERDFSQGVEASTAPLVRDRGERLRGLKDYVLNAAGRLYVQQLVIVEFKVLNSFRQELSRFIAQDLSEEMRREQEQAALRKALFSYRTQAAEMEDAELGFVMTEARVAELSTTLETVLREFPDSAMARLEEVRKMERQARRGKSTEATTGRGRKRKGIAKALGVSLSLVGMLRPPGYGNLQGFIGYATSMLGLPLDLLLGVQNDGDSPEVMGEDREYPILRLQPKIKFDIDLQ